MKGFFSYIYEIVKIVAIALLIVIPIRYFVFQPFVVKGESMEPNLYDKDYLIVDELTYRLRAPHRGEIVIVDSPNGGSRYIKRIIALPGETVEIREGEVFIYKNGTPGLLDESSYLPLGIETEGDTFVSLEHGEYFVMGDNRMNSYDSRRFGPLSKSDIIGRAIFRALPINELSLIEVPAY